jgi:alkanesulfonate monooxygenase SsuD/methylene tetrahydromethanopterin reductase-like flavin-dependent oxidoreductase (luciferase family)
MGRPLRLSIAFDGSQALDTCQAVVRAAETAGLDGVWSAEHLGLHDAVTASAAFLVTTSRIEVGLVGLNASSRHPGLLAMELASLAELGKGRVRAQLGTGDAILGARIGARSRRPLGEVEAFVAAIRALQRGEEVSVDEPEFRLDRFRLRRFRPAPRTPLDVMAIRPAMLELACRIGDGVALSAGASRAYLAESMGAIERHLATHERVRSRFRISAMVLAAVGDDLSEARRRVAKVLAFAPPGAIPALTAGLDGLPDPEVVRATLGRDGPAAAAAMYPDEVVDALSIVATPAGLPAAIERFAALGIDELALTLTGDLEDMLTATSALGHARAGAMAGAMGAEAGGRL